MRSRQGESHKTSPEQNRTAVHGSVRDLSANEAFDRLQQPATLDSDDILTLQATVGNRAVESVTAGLSPTQRYRTPNSPVNLSQFINSPVIQREDDQAENLFSERNYARITNEQQQQIESFASRAQTIIAPWGQLRETHAGGESSIDHDTYIDRVRQIKSQLYSTYRQFQLDFGQTVTTQPTVNDTGGILLPPSHIHQISFQQHNLAKAEMARQLNQGFFPQYFRELQTLHNMDGAILIDIEHMMAQYAGVDFPRFPHIYRLKTIIGLEGGAGEGVSVGAFIRSFTIEYSNPLGMSWRLNTYGGGLKGGAGFSVSPVEANIDTSLGSQEINAGTANELRYYPPSYFRVNLVTVTTAGAGAGGGVAVGRMSFGDVDFDTSGLTLKFGTSNVGEAGVDIGIGAFFGGRPYNVEQLASPEAAELQPRGAQWIPVIAGRCHFRTEEATLDAEDEASLDRVVEAILRHERFYPGDIFRIGVKGFATQRWETPEASARGYGVDTSDIEQSGVTREERQSMTAERLNEQLARNRARITGEALASRILAQEASFTPAVIDRSSLHDNQYQVIHEDSPDADTNAATNRYVQIAVYYNNSPEGNVNYNPMAE